MLSSLVVILLIISCSISLMVQCFKRKQTKKDSSPAAKKQELKRRSSKGHDALAAKQGKLDNKKPPARDVRRKTDTPKKDKKPNSPPVQKNKKYLFQLLVPVTTYVLSPCGKRKKEKSDKEMKTAIDISPYHVHHGDKSAGRKKHLDKLKPANVIHHSLKHKTARSIGHHPPQAAAIKAQSDTNAVNLAMGEIVGDFKVTGRLGAGGCGVVYKVISKKGKNYAMKVERTNLDKSEQLLPLEAHILKRLQSSPHATQFIQYGSCQAREGGFRVLIMGLLGPPLNELLKHQTKKHFSIMTVLKIGIQALRSIAFMHIIYFVHRDIKPSNFAIDQVNLKRIYLFDFGLARSIKTRGEPTMRKPRTDVPFRGTQAYCSLNAHKRMEHGRHDDLWSLIYMLVEFCTGSLPWQGKTRIITKLLKTKLMDFQYMFGCPIAFNSILNYLRRLDYYKRPDYLGIERAFFRMLESRHLKWNFALDWEVIERPKALGVSVPQTTSENSYDDNA